MNAKERLKKLLDELPLDSAQRALYGRGLANMSEREAASVADDLEAAFAKLPEALEALERLLEKHRSKG